MKDIVQTLKSGLEGIDKHSSQARLEALQKIPEEEFESTLNQQLERFLRKEQEATAGRSLIGNMFHTANAYLRYEKHTWSDTDIEQLAERIRPRNADDIYQALLLPGKKGLNAFKAIEGQIKTKFVATKHQHFADAADRLFREHGTLRPLKEEHSTLKHEKHDHLSAIRLLLDFCDATLKPCVLAKFVVMAEQSKPSIVDGYVKQSLDIQAFSEGLACKNLPSDRFIIKAVGKEEDNIPYIRDNMEAIEALLSPVQNKQNVAQALILAEKSEYYLDLIEKLCKPEVKVEVNGKKHTVSHADGNALAVDALLAGKVKEAKFLFEKKYADISVVYGKLWTGFYQVLLLACLSLSKGEGKAAGEHGWKALQYGLIEPVILTYINGLKLLETIKVQLEPAQATLTDQLVSLKAGWSCLFAEIPKDVENPVQAPVVTRAIICGA